MKIIGSTNSDKVFESRLREQFAVITQRIAPKLLEAVIREMEEHFAEKDPKTLLQCDKCNGWSSEDLDACPYCGEGGVITKDAPPPSSIGPVNLSGRPDIASAPDLTVANTSEIVSDEQTLDAKIGEFRACMSRSAHEFVRACEIVAELRDRHWQQRREADGKPKYKSFDAFVKAELGISRQRAHEMIKVREEGLLDAVPLLGIEATKIIALAPNEKREALIESAKAGASTRALAAAAHPERARAEAPTTNEVRARHGLEPVDAPPRRPAEPHALTVTLREKTSVHVYQGTPTDEQPKRAKRLSSDAWFEVETADGRTLLVEIKADRKKNLRAEITVERGADEDDDAAE